MTYGREVDVCMEETIFNNAVNNIKLKEDTVA